MHTGYANVMFAWTIVLPIALFHLGFILGFFIRKRTSQNVTVLQEYVKSASIIVAIGQGILSLLGYAIFFYWTCNVFLPKLGESG